MELKSGLRLRSQVCGTEVIVVRPPRGLTELRCGGQPMVSIDTEVTGELHTLAGLDGGNQMGKRYMSAGDDTLEVLVTKAGEGTLADADDVLVVKQHRPLPSSD